MILIYLLKDYCLITVNIDNSHAVYEFFVLSIQITAIITARIITRIIINRNFLRLARLYENNINKIKSNKT
jgi:hypothetical protein